MERAGEAGRGRALLCTPELWYIVAADEWLLEQDSDLTSTALNLP